MFGRCVPSPSGTQFSLLMPTPHLRAGLMNAVASRLESSGPLSLATSRLIADRSSLLNTDRSSAIDPLFVPTETSSMGPPSCRAAAAFATSIPDDAPENRPPRSLPRRDAPPAPRNSSPQPSCCRWLCPAPLRQGCREPTPIPSRPAKKRLRGRIASARRVAAFLSSTACTRNYPRDPTETVRLSLHRSSLSPFASVLRRAHAAHSSTTTDHSDRSHWSLRESAWDRGESSSLRSIHLLFAIAGYSSSPARGRRSLRSCGRRSASR